MARASESFAAGVNHNTSRVGAVVGEYNKLKKHLEWALDVSMADVLKRNNKGRTERDQALQDLMTQLFESMDKLQENMKLVAERIEKGHRQRQLQHTILRSHLWDILACHRVAHHWHR